MCGRHDLGGAGSECASARSSGIYMVVQNVVWTLQGVLSRSALRCTFFVFFNKEKALAHIGIPAAKCREAGLV